MARHKSNWRFASPLDDELRERQNELSWLAAEGHKAVVAIEGFRLVILGVHHEGKHRDFRSRASLQAIPQKHTAKL